MRSKSDDPCVNLQEKLIRRAWEDEAFAERLRSNPRVAIAEATGIEIAGNVKVFVHHESDKTLHLVVPERPHDGATDPESFQPQAITLDTVNAPCCHPCTHDCGDQSR